MKELKTRINFSFKGKLGKERKSRHQFIYLTMIDGHDHVDDQKKKS